MNEYFSDCKADENWWAAMNYECNGDEKVLASWENTKPQDSRHASYKSDIPKLEGILDDSSADLRQHKAAVTIQRWVRGWIVRRQASHYALKELLSRKKQEKEKQMKWGQDNVLTEVQYLLCFNSYPEDDLYVHYTITYQGIGPLNNDTFVEKHCGGSLSS